MTQKTTPCGRAATLLFSAAFLQWGVAFSAHGQSALDGFDPHANAPIRAIAVQADGKALIGGDFTSFTPNGGSIVNRDHLARLNPDGTVDPNFLPTVNGTVRTIVVQPNGHILIGGDFTLVNKVTRNHIARLDPTGALDSFDPNADDIVRAITVQHFNGEVVFGGDFISIAPNGTSAVKRPHIARVSATGSLDSTFRVDVDNSVLAIALEGDNILMGGVFTTINSVTRNHVAQIKIDGSLDTAFDPNANEPVFAINVTIDGAIFVGGDFTALAPSVGPPAARRMIARLNNDGSVQTSFNAAASGFVVEAISIDSENRVLVGGEFGSMGGQLRNRIARLDPVRGLADSFDPNANSLVNCLALQEDGKVLAGGNFSALAPNSGAAVARNFIARLEIDGRLDQTLVSPFSGSNVRAIALQTDNKILLGGFVVFGTGRNNIGRLNTDGTIDLAFNPNANNSVDCIATQADGKVLAGGDFASVSGGNSIGGQPRNNIARLDSTTGLADSFNPSANGSVFTIAVQPDGKILVGGSFTHVGGATRNNIARLDATTGLADSFNPNPDLQVRSVAVQVDGRILIAGDFTHIGGQLRNHIARLNPDGTLDATFNPNANGPVEAIAIQEGSKILIGGNFTTLSPNGGAAVTRGHIARLNLDGTLDLGFNPNASDEIRSIVLQSDGKILIGGFFTSIGGQLRNLIARLDGTSGFADSFNPNPNVSVDGIAVQADGKILVCGGFFNISGQSRNFFARLTNDTAALQTLTVTPTTITLARGGSSPQYTHVTFESSTDDLNFTFLGNGTPSGTSWTLSGATLPTGQNVVVRARGFYRSGLVNGSESTLGTRHIAFFPGSFVIGDGNAVVGQHIVFWGAQWAKSNSLSGGSAPNNFKGFANVTSTVPAACGGTWSSDSGNGAGAPSGVPASINVIVASSITQSGGAISGDVAQTAVVQPDPGYHGDPGHPGTGTVLSLSCAGQQ